jgi:dephospho-CoA kinase
MRSPFCVGLTGGIGCGKSSATDMFLALGAGIVDTDEIARELTRPGGKAMEAIRDAFGPEYIAPDGGLDRRKMRRLVFSDPQARKKLESILHPLIREEARRRIAAASAPYVIVVVPLLLETGAYRDLISRVAVVDCSEALQVARTTARSGLTDEEVRAIMAAQLPRAERLAAADDVLNNDGDFESLRRQVDALHRKYLALAREASSTRDARGS